MPDNLTQITDYLLEESRKKAGVILREAEKEAANIMAHTSAKALKEQAVIQKRYQKRAGELKETAVLKNQMDKHRILLGSRQHLIDQTLMKVRKKFEEQGAEEWLKYIGIMIEEGKKETDEEPVIQVPSSYYKETLAHFGDKYQVEERKIQSGFILSYHNFDLNYEVEHFFHYQKEEMEIAAMELLFHSEAESEFS